jgi:hypothetical protein
VLTCIERDAKRQRSRGQRIHAAAAALCWRFSNPVRLLPFTLMGCVLGKQQQSCLAVHYVSPCVLPRMMTGTAAVARTAAAPLEQCHTYRACCYVLSIGTEPYAKKRALLDATDNTSSPRGRDAVVLADDTQIP